MTTNEHPDTVRVVTRPGGKAFFIDHIEYNVPDDSDQRLERDHRDGGPAAISVYPEDPKDHLVTAWTHHAKRHRLDGPAYAKSGGSLSWTVNRQNVVRVSRRERRQ